VRRLLPARVAELLRFHPLSVLLFVLRRCVVAVFAIPALQRNDFSHFSKPFPSQKTVR
jgi:predicted lipid carrier protein YhbT